MKLCSKGGSGSLGLHLSCYDLEWLFNVCFVAFVCFFSVSQIVQETADFQPKIDGHGSK